jgi:predicted ATPase/DNA-binding SARP family transcriptional activator
VTKRHEFVAGGRKGGRKGGGMGEVLEVGTFGGLRIRVGGVDVGPFDARSAEALLVYLALQGRTVPRDVLADLLWPEHDAERSRANLRSAVYRLRRLLPEHLHADRRAIGLVGALEVDALEFERRLLARDVAGAAAIYGGDFLAGFRGGASAVFEAWVASEGERLRALALAAHQGAVERTLAEGPDEALRAGTDLLTLEPLHEPTLRLVMRLLHDAGRAPEAVVRFDAFVRRLRDELGVEPDDATMRLATAIRRGDRTDLSRAESAPAATTSPDGAAATADDALPAYADPLVGRAVELETVRRRLADPECRWLTVMGAGGAGKTRLAVEAIRQQGERGAGRTVFVPLAGVPAPDLLLPTVVSALGVTTMVGRDLATQLLAYLRGRRLLLVLDNLEHLIDGVASLADVVRRAPGVRVLATSRTRLHLPEEWLLPLGGLTTGSEAMFARHASRVTDGFDPIRSEAAVARVCALVGGLPLAIELAAGWVHVLSPEGIAAALEDDLSLLRAPRPDLPARHHSIDAVFAASWAQLEGPLARIYAMLAPFRGGFTAAAAARVAGASVTDLGELADRSLLHACRDGRFELHELLRRFALSRLDEFGGRDAAHRAHAEVYAEAAEAACADVLGSRVQAGRAAFHVERDNLRAALDWSITSGARDLVVRLIDACSSGWRLTSSFTEARRWLERAGALPDLSRRDRVVLESNAGHFAWMGGEYEEADERLRSAASRWDDVGEEERLLRTRIHVSLGMTRFTLRDADGAVAAIRTALQELAEVDLPEARWWRAVAHGWLGKSLLLAGDVAAAGDALDTCLAGFTELGNAWGLGLFMTMAAELLYAQRDLDAARRHAERAVVLLEGVGFTHALAPTCTLLGRIASDAGDSVEGARWNGRAAELYRELGDEASAAAAGATLDRHLE